MASSSQLIGMDMSEPRPGRLNSISAGPLCAGVLELRAGHSTNVATKRLARPTQHVVNRVLYS